jgi:hypothetical protein
MLKKTKSFLFFSLLTHNYQIKLFIQPGKQNCPSIFFMNFLYKFIFDLSYYDYDADHVSTRKTFKILIYFWKGRKMN